MWFNGSSTKAQRHLFTNAFCYLLTYITCTKIRNRPDWSHSVNVALSKRERWRLYNKLGFSSLREITNYWRSYLRLLSSIFQLNFYPKQIWRMVWNLNKRNRNDNVAVTHTTSPRAFQRSRDVVTFVKLSNLVEWGLTLSHWWQVLWILSSLKKLKNVMPRTVYSIYSNTIFIYPWFLPKGPFTRAIFGAIFLILTKWFFSYIDLYSFAQMV